MRCLSVFLIAAFAALGATPASGAPVAVESFTGNHVYTITLPGTPAAGGLDFGTSMTFTSLDFSPGSVDFQGQPVDFDGTEADFLATTFSGTTFAPASMGPATVMTTVSLTMSGPGTAADFSGSHSGVELGPGYGSSAADVVVGSGSSYTATSTNWNSSVIPELNGARITIFGSQTTTSVDMLNGIIDGTGDGTITAEIVALWTASRWGIALLSIGFLGALSLWLFFRPRREDVGLGKA